LSAKNISAQKGPKLTPVFTSPRGLPATSARSASPGRLIEGFYQVAESLSSNRLIADQKDDFNTPEVEKRAGMADVPKGNGILIDREREDQDFFLSAAGESTELAPPRECWEIKRTRGDVRDDCMLISIEPPYREPRGIGYRDVYKFVIATRFKGHSLLPITSMMFRACVT
jgi:hypothetical protein